MNSIDQRGVVDSRALYWAYAAIAWAGGFVLAAWGQIWLGSHFPGQPWGKAAVIRMFGVFIMAAGCFAASAATAADPISRRRTQWWFLAANAIVLVMFTIEQHAVWSTGPVEDAATLLFVVVALLVLSAAPGAEAGPYPQHLTTLFGGQPRWSSTRHLRSRYEQQIREAAGQEERNRLARELHDSIKQQLFVVQTAAATVQARWDADTAGAKAALDQVRGSARDAMTEMEVLLDQLRAAPLENVGLVEALKKQCEALGLRTGAEVSFEPGALPAARRLPPGAAQAIFRIAQEALANVARHARAAHVRVSLAAVGDQVQLAVHDDGAGFDGERVTQGMGLTNMRERASEFGGDVVTHSQPAKGTTVTLTIPCLPEDPGFPEYRTQAWLALGLLIVNVVIGLQQPDMLAMTIIPVSLLVRALMRLRRASAEAGS